jgi:uncharacterized protein YndB with AHSA1/START domain
MSIRETVSGRVDAPPAVVFEHLIDVSKLPEWNRAITEVVEAPSQLAPGTTWKVRIHALGKSWVSRSQVTELDPAARRFSYRSQSDDGNPSFADWAWQVDSDDGNGSTVSVTVALEPMTFWRKHLLVKIRRPALRSEMQASLSALGTALHAI